MYTSLLSLKPCRNDTLYLKTIDWKINTFELHCWASALYPNGKLSLLMANALKKHKSPKARLVLHCSCIVAANINQSFWTCEVVHCPWSSVTESRPTFDVVWIITPAWKCLVSFLKQLYSPLNCPNKRDMLNRTSSSVRHWMLGPWFCKHRCPCSSAPLRWPQEAPWKSPLPPLLSHLLPRLCGELRASALDLSFWLSSLSPSLAFLPPFLCSLHPRLLMTGSKISHCPLRLEKRICSYRKHKNVLLLLLVPPLITEHRTLGALPGYWLSLAAPGRERRQNPLLASLFSLRPMYTETQEELLLPLDGPYEVRSASGYHTASWLAW